MKLILVCDYGLDDASATYDALSHAIADGYEEVTLVAVGGNVPSEIALKNAKKLVANCDCSLPPVVIVDTTMRPQPHEYLKTIHGNDGMGDLFAEKPCNVPSVSLDEWLKSTNGEYDLLSLGPMTLVGELLAHIRCRKFIFMGGNIAEEPNFHGYEFNHALNREAFSAVVKKYPHVAITMDTCRNPYLNVQNVVIDGEDIPHKIVRRSCELTFVSGEKGCYIWDDMAVKYLRHPDWFSLYTATDKDGNKLTVAKYTYHKAYLEIIDK